MHRFTKFLKSFFGRAFFIYAAIGTLNTFNTALFSSLLALVINKNGASYIGYILSLTIGYFLNARMNFHHRISTVEYLRFMSSYIPSFIIYAVLSTVAINAWHWWPFFSSVLAALAGVPVTYALMYFYAFRRQKDNAASEEQGQ